MNPNTFYAETFVDALARAGLDAVCIAPGSRSTPLTLAFAKHEGIEKYTHLDERSAAFFALGMAMASDKPVAMVCTSGTAAANFFPAIIEANMSRVPLLVLTADRPHELRHSGANQTIDQVKMYGDHVLWSVDMALPEANPPEIAVRNLRTMAARALATADGRMEFRRKGVVHLNFPFRKPLEPEIPEKSSNEPVDSSEYASVVFDSQTHPPHGVLLYMQKIVNENPNGVIVCGPHCGDPRSDIGHELAMVSSLTGYPVIAGVDSGIRLGYADRGKYSVIGGYDFLELDALLADVDVVLQFGGVPSSKKLMGFLDRVRPHHRIGLGETGWGDDTHRLTMSITGNAEGLAFELTNTLEERAEKSPLLYTLKKANKLVWDILAQQDAMQEFHSASIVPRIVDALPEKSPLFLGNSSPIRYFDTFAHMEDKYVYVYSSRGASGIDGQVSTALGIGTANESHVYAILGDITFYHDMNGLLAVQRNGITATFIVINNNGGGIFERLPIREHEPHYTEYFTTPHGLTFEHAAAMYGLEYAFADDFDSLDAALDKYINADVSSIIEVKTDIKTDEARRKEIIELVNQQIRQSLSDNQ